MYLQTDLNDPGQDRDLGEIHSTEDLYLLWKQLLYIAHQTVVSDTERRIVSQ